MERFRITLWPKDGVPVPAVFPVQSGLVVTEDAIISTRAGGRLRELPPELYLREVARLNLDSVPAIQAFVDEFGFLGVGRHLPGTSAPSLPGQSCYLPMSYPLIKENRRVEALLDGQREDEEDLPPPMETLAEFRAGVRLIRDATRIYAAFMAEELDEGPFEWESGDLFDRAAGLDRPRSEEESLKVLTAVLRLGLADIGPLATVRNTQSDEAVNTEALYSNGLLYPMLIGQLFNHIVEGAEYRRCDNETCGGIFYRQEGRAHAGQHKTIGVKYCSKQCAKAQAQRDYRRRNRKGIK